MLTVFHPIDRIGLGPPYPPVGIAPMPGENTAPGPPTRLLAQAYQHLWLVHNYGVYQEFACADLAVHPSPSSPDAGESTVYH